jgi:ketosteroid isomerase-like protein
VLSYNVHSGFSRLAGNIFVLAAIFFDVPSALGTWLGTRIVRAISGLVAATTIGAVQGGGVNGGAFVPDRVTSKDDLRTKGAATVEDDAVRVASAYFDAWKVDDFDAMRSLVHDDVTFAGPLGRREGAEDYMEGIMGLSRIKTDIVVQKTFVDGPDVLTWYELSTTVAPPVPVANWLHVEDGRITSLRVAFDARGLAP